LFTDGISSPKYLSAITLLTRALFDRPAIRRSRQQGEVKILKKEAIKNTMFFFEFLTHYYSPEMFT
jgi:hypothetical protein